jgi:subtilisin-like proprotein convertase family protein
MMHLPETRNHMNWLAGFVAALALTVALPAHAAVPSQVSIEGYMQSTGGGPASDGNYAITFALYKIPVGGVAVWTEGPVTVYVKGGMFTHELGSKTPLTAALLGGFSGSAWLGIQIGSDPEITRRPTLSVPFALRAAIAEGLDCSGCIGLAQIDAQLLTPYAKASALAKVATTGLFADLLDAPDLTSFAKSEDFAKVAFSGSYFDLAGAPDLTKYPKTSALATVALSGAYADLSGTPQLSKVAFTGSHADLNNPPTLAKLGVSCGTGLVVKGLKADGSYECVASMDASSLPPDGLNEISNNLLTNQFSDTRTGTPGLKLLDNNPVGVSDFIDFPDIGVAQKLTVSIDMANSNLASVTVSLYDPNAVEYVLHDKAAVGSILKTSWPEPTKTVKGDLTTWLGKNPKGKWFLKVVDGAYLNNGFDGQVTSWSISISTLSSKKVQVKGDLLLEGDVQLAPGKQLMGQATFHDLVTFENSWCPTQPNGAKSMVVGGVCTPGVGTNMTWEEAVAFCSAKKADLCSDAQALVLRRYGLLGNYTSYGNWTNSWADNDSGVHNEATGNIGDDHSAGERWAAPCCYNATPARDTDQVVKVAAGDKGIRVTYIHPSKDAPFQYAAAYCAWLNSDVCTKSNLVYLRTAGKIPSAQTWPNDGQDTDGYAEYGTGGMANDVTFHQPYGFACCAGERPTATVCPTGATETGGVCTAKIVNSASVNWVNAANDCGALGAHVCSVSESSVLRKAGVLTVSGNWTAGMNDCDGYCSSTYGAGSVGNDINPAATYGYACCL